ncbi:MAG: hypothetical protein SGILL_000562 [Bacillariaceae sp.]
MDDNPFEIPPLMAGGGGKDKENPAKTTTLSKSSKLPSASSKSLQQYKFQRQHHDRLNTRDANKRVNEQKSKSSSLSSSTARKKTSPRWNGKFASSLALASGREATANPASGPHNPNGSKLLSSSRPLRSVPSQQQQQASSSSTRRSSHNNHPSPQPQSRHVSSLTSPALAVVRSSLPTSSSKYNSSLGSTTKIPGGVLRSGETMSGFFSVSQDSSDDYIRLVEGLVDGSRAKDPTTWRRVLEIASQDHSKQKSDDSYYQLIRMYRRATMRFPLDYQELSQLSSERQRRDVMKLWVSYAQLYAKSGDLEEARNTFHHIENKSKGLHDLVQHKDHTDVLESFFLAFATFENEQCHNKDAAKHLLQRAIQETKDSGGMLQKAIKRIETIRLSGSSSPLPSLKSTQRSPLSTAKKADRTFSPATREHTSSRFDSSLISSRRSPMSHMKRSVVNGERSRSPKRFKSENMTIDRNSIPRHVSIRSPSHTLDRTTDISTLKSTPAMVTATETGLHGKPPTASTKKRSSFTSRLGPRKSALSGAPKRIEADQSVLNDDSTDDSDEDSVGEEDTKVPSFKKMDLSYIWSWKPKGQTDTDKQETSIGGGQPTHGSGNSSNHSGAESKLEENDTQVRKEREALKREKEEKEKEMIASEEASDMSRALVTDQTGAPTPAADKATSRNEALLAGANLEFLPLVHEENILRVKKESYVKLGVVGKGGSCKVYRALSKKCSVVAIKKVKLEGMTKKQIAGYANEISLLKRLKSNPSIIRMYDSELDLKRKCLFVVMELGEVDLSYVLRQRANAQTSKSLDLNFVRLTWQQMLSAVHSIHEAKIIHSDLKPANFLFVRGALKLIDFGIAKAIEKPEDTTKIVRESQIGTLNYMSPESIMDTGEGGENGPRMKIGRASDVWSLGCILYEMVYGTTPFASYHFIAKLQAIINEDHTIKFPDAGESGEAAIDAMKQCLQRRPEDRPPIIGKNGLLNEHWFLHSTRRSDKK